MEAARDPASDPLPELTAGDISRYARHLILPEVGVEGQRKLKAARAFALRCGRQVIGPQVADSNLPANPTWISCVRQTTSRRGCRFSHPQAHTSIPFTRKRRPGCLRQAKQSSVAVGAESEKSSLSSHYLTRNAGLHRFHRCGSTWDRRTRAARPWVARMASLAM